MNELYFILFIIIDMFIVLLFLKLWGKAGIIACYVAHIILSQVTVQMQITLFSFTTIFGSMLFAILFLCTDILTEHYGPKIAYKTIMMGAGVLLFFIFVIQAALLFVPSSTNTVFSSFTALFSNQWRIVIADLLISYLIFQLLNVHIFHKIRILTKNKFLWLRSNAATMICQIFVAVLFFQIAFYGIIPQPILWQIIIVGLIMKLIITIFETPYIYLSYKFLPKGYSIKEREN